MGVIPNPRKKYLKNKLGSLTACSILTNDICKLSRNCVDFESFIRNIKFPKAKNFIFVMICYLDANEQPIRLNNMVSIAGLTIYVHELCQVSSKSDDI